MEGKALQPYTGLGKSLLHVINLAVNARQIKKIAMRMVQETRIENEASNTVHDSKAFVDSVTRYTLALRRAAAFKLYERLFSLWHILHLPLFIMMIITATIHIFAVHMY